MHHSAIAPLGNHSAIGNTSCRIQDDEFRFEAPCTMHHAARMLRALPLSLSGGRQTSGERWSVCLYLLCLSLWSVSLSLWWAANQRRGRQGSHCHAPRTRARRLPGACTDPEMCSGSEAGSYLRLIDLAYHSTLGLIVIQKEKKKHRCWCGILELREFQTAV